MDRQERLGRLAQMIRQVAPDGAVEALRAEPIAGLEAAPGGPPPDIAVNEADEGLRTLTEGRALSDAQAFGLEGIVMPKYRPVVDIIRDDYGQLPDPWTHLESKQARATLRSAIPSIGRIELPGHPRYPYAGTGFVVGDNLLMTNRHVAEIFCTGLGVRNLAFRSGVPSGIDFVQEAQPRPPEYLNIEEVMLIHPYWDMAILRVSGFEPRRNPLKLSVVRPEDLAERDIAVIGYPAQDPRNDYRLQYQIFRGIFDVKRLQPGKVKKREWIVDSFGNRVFTVTHDASTLGGNSGSAVIDVATGEVVGLHFGGQYLKVNYAVPAYELARDRRVVKAGLNFTGSVPPTDEWNAKWLATETGEKFFIARAPTPLAITPNNGLAAASQAPVATATPSLPLCAFDIPLHVTVSIGSLAPAMIPSIAPGTQLTAPAMLAGLEVPLKTPIIYDDLESRAGFDPAFLDLEDGAPLPMPALTAAGLGIAARLEDGSHELKYHKFSITMHKKRRLALLTMANIDWRDSQRKPDGRKPSRTELTGIPDGFAEEWVTDPRIPDSCQLPDIFFTKDRKAFDKGHIVRRDDVCWGSSFEDIQMANGDTFHTTNCSPQVSGFNQANGGEFNWGDLENMIQKQTKAERAIVYAGPVFTAHDPVFTGKDAHGTVRIPIPQAFWKIIVMRGEGGPEAFGFVLEQDLSGIAWEMMVPAPWKSHMKSIEEIEALLGGVIDLGALKPFDKIETRRLERIRESNKIGIRDGVSD